ncbi:MAG TPA: ABC transporter substrate-binding protein [Clostridiales bacterium]|nr:ABC transporter substrate-binding protein [Clostridiales bacterium]
MKNTLKSMVILLLAVLILGTAAACSPSGDTAPSLLTTDAPSTGDEADGKLIFVREEKLEYATEFTLTHYEGGYKEFTVSSAPDKKYLIVPENRSVPAGLDGSTLVLKQPISKICFNSSSLVSLLDAIGGLESVATVGSKIDTWYVENVVAKMQSGDIKYSGSFRTPDFEMLSSEGIELVIDTTMLANHPEVTAKYDELSIPYFMETSAREGHPLGRVEWVKLLGALLGLEEEAKAYFKEQVDRVNAVTAREKTGKTVAMFYLSTDAQQVYPRNGGDYMAQMIGLAGGTYIMADVAPDKSGGTSMTMEDVYSRCVDADYLFYINFVLSFSSLEEMLEKLPLLADFKAVKEGRVYITSPDFTQATAAIGGIIEDMNTVLREPGIDSTNSLIKLK